MRKLLLLILFLFFISSVSAPKTDYLGLVSNTQYCTSSCQTIYELKKPTVMSADKTAVNVGFYDLKNSDITQKTDYSIEYLLKKEFSESVDVWGTKKVCEQRNLTQFCWQEPVITGTKALIKYNYEWVPTTFNALKDIFYSIDVGQSVLFKIKGKIKLGEWKDNIVGLPGLGYSYTEYAVWDGTKIHEDFSTNSNINLSISTAGINVTGKFMFVNQSTSPADYIIYDDFEVAATCIDPALHIFTQDLGGSLYCNTTAFHGTQSIQFNCALTEDCRVLNSTNRISSLTSNHTYEIWYYDKLGVSGTQYDYLLVVDDSAGVLRYRMENRWYSGTGDADYYYRMFNNTASAGSIPKSVGWKKVRVWVNGSTLNGPRKILATINGSVLFHKNYSTQTPYPNTASSYMFAIGGLKGTKNLWDYLRIYNGTTPPLSRNFTLLSTPFTANQSYGWAKCTLNYTNFGSLECYIRDTTSPDWTYLPNGTTTSFDMTVDKIFQYKINGTRKDPQNNGKLYSLDIVFGVASFPTVTYTSGILETDLTTISLNITTNATYNAALTKAVLVYNSIRYGVTGTVFTNTGWNSTIFSKNLRAARVDAPKQNISFYWEYNLTTNPGANESYTTTTKNQEIYRMILYNCTNATLGNIRTLAFNFVNESNNVVFSKAQANVTNMKLEKNYVVWNYSSDINRNYSFSFYKNATPFVCIYPSWTDLHSDSIMTYTADGYVTRSYHLINALLKNESQSISLYQLISGISSNVVITIKDQNDNDVPDAYIKTLRYYPETNIYKVVEVSKTDTSGQALVHIVGFDIWYKFIIEKNGIVYLTTQVQKMLYSTYTFRINLVSPSLAVYEGIEGISSSLGWNAGSQTLTFTATDSTGISKEFCVEIVKMVSNKEKTMCSSCSSSASVSLNCVVSGTMNGVYIGRGYVNAEGGSIHLLQKWETIINNIFAVFGATGTFLSIFLLGSVVFAFFWSPVAAIVMTIFGFIIMGIMGFINFVYGGAVLLVLIGLLLLYKIKN